MAGNNVDTLLKTGDFDGSESSNSSARMGTQDHGRFLEAAEHTGKGAAADTECAQATDAEIVRQARRFIEWAAKTGSLISPERLQALRLVSSTTSEHKVYFNPETNRAVKQTLPGEFGWMPAFDRGRWSLEVATPLDYFRRWHLFNQVFGDDARLEGASIVERPVTSAESKVELISAVISQPWREAMDIRHPIPSDREVSTYLSQLGFELLPDAFAGWRRADDGVVILDAFQDNFIATRDGVAPIDLPITREEPED